MDIEAFDDEATGVESSSRQESDELLEECGRAAPDAAVPPHTRRQRRKRRGDPMIKRVFQSGKLLRHSKNLRFRDVWRDTGGVEWEPLLVLLALFGTIFYMVRSQSDDAFHPLR